jgi:large subunit ribosomal protein L21
MYAVIETGGKQYRVEVGTELEVELLDAKPGDAITLDRVFLVADGDMAAIGRPIVDGAVVSAEVLRHDRGEKLIAFKYRPKARRRVKKGHRQDLHVLRITDVVLNGKSAAASLEKAVGDSRTERQRLEAAAARQAAEDAALAAKLAAKSARAAEAPVSGPKADKASAKTTTAEIATTPKRPRAKAADAGKAKVDKAKVDKAKVDKAADAGEAKAEAPKRRATKKDA